MAQRNKKNPRAAGKGTSFGKKSTAEKDFRSKKKSRPGDSFPSERRQSGPAAFTRPRRSGGAPGGFSKSRPDAGGDSFRERSEGPKRFSKPFRSEGGDEKPFRRSTGASPSFGKKGSFGKTEGDFKKPFKKPPFSSAPRGGDSFEGKADKPGFARPFRKEGEAKSFGKGSRSSGFERPGRFEKSSDNSDFKKPFGKPAREEKDSGGSSESSAAKFGFTRPSRSKGKDETLFQKSEKSAASFDRPGKFEKSGGPKRGDFKKPFGKKIDSPDAETSRSSEKKSFEGGERKPYIKRTYSGKSKSFKPKVWEEKPSDGLIRLNKYIANSGVCSRREADNLITMGLISVNKVTITELGYKVKPGDQVRYEDKLLKAEKPVYLLLNKPKGFITTTDDPQERNTVMNLVASACKERIYPVGRLDRNTTGLLLLTNDGDLAERLMHPSYNVKKIYKVELDRPITKNDFIKIQEGVQLPEGKAIVDDVAIASDDGKTIGVEIHIGWNRVVRRIFETLGYEVVRLDRSVYAGLDKKDLGRGEWRFLKPEEVVRLKHFKG